MNRHVTVASFPLTTILYSSAYWKVSEYNFFFFNKHQLLNYESLTSYTFRNEHRDEQSVRTSCD